MHQNSRTHNSGELMKKIILLSVMSFLIFGCDSIEGVITLNQKLNFMTQSSGGCNGDASFGCEPRPDSVKAGQHSVQIEQRNRSEISIKIGSGLKSKYISLNTQNREIPMNGRFVLTAAESGQPFDIDVNLKTDITDGPMMHDRNSCTVERRGYEQCYLIPGGPNSKGINRCITRIDVYYGMRDMDYFNRTTHTQLAGVLVASGQNVAQMNGDRSNSDRIITYDSGCANQYFSHTREEVREYPVK